MIKVANGILIKESMNPKQMMDHLAGLRAQTKGVLKGSPKAYQPLPGGVTGGMMGAIPKKEEPIGGALRGAVMDAKGRVY